MIDIIDIETVPREDCPLPEFDPAKVPTGQAKKPETINAKIDEAKAEFDLNIKAFKEAGTGPLAKAMSLDPERGRIFSVGHIRCEDSGEEISRACYAAETLDLEAKVLKDIRDVLQDGNLIMGFNIKSFDIPYIWKRGIISRVPVFRNYLDLVAKYKHNKAMDLMTVWTNYDPRMASQDHVCRVLGIEGKGDMDGSKVYPAFLKGEFDKIMEYNLDDCEKVREIAMRFGVIG